MELNFEYYQKVAEGLSPFIMHFPDQTAIVFYLDSVTGKIMQSETSTDLGEWGNRVMSDSTIAYKVKSFLECKSFYIPRELYFAYPTDSKQADILYYDTITKQFKSIVTNFMQYPVVYSKFEANFDNGYGLAILENAYNVKIKEVINGEFTLSFVLPRDDEKWEFIQADNFIKVEEQLYRIKTFDELRNQNGNITSNIQCEHVYYDAIDSKHIPFYGVINGDPKTILQDVFSGTRFTIGTVDITTPVNLTLDKTNPAAVVAELVKRVGGELIKDNYTIHLINKRGSYNGVQFRFGKNIKGIQRVTDSKGLVTRLYPYGKDSLNVASVNNGLDYVDSPLLSLYDRPKIGYLDFNDIDNAADLLVKGQEQFSTSEKDGIDKPSIIYSVDVVELKKMKQYGIFEEFVLGDTVRIIDEGLNIDTVQRIVSYEYYPYEANKSSVEITNISLKEYKNSTSQGVINGFTKTQNTVEKIITDEGTVNAGWLENIKDKLITLFNNGLKSAVMHKMGDIWVDDPENPTKAMGILADGFAIANSKDANNQWVWKTFGTADGFVADLINAGTLRAINIIGATIKTDDDGNDRLEMTTDGVVAKSSDNVRNGVTLEKCSESGFSDFYGQFYYVDGTLAGGLLMNIVNSDNRLWLKTNNGYKLKIKSDSDMSIGASNGKTIYIAADEGALNIVMCGGTWNFNGATVTGLESSGYAKTSDISSAISSEDTAIRNWVTANFAPKA